MLNFFVFPAIAIFLLYLAFKGIDLKKIWQELFNVDYKWIFLSLILAIGGMYFRALRWRLLLQSVNLNPPVKTTFYAVIMGYFANMAIPRIGELTRCASLNKTNNIPVDVSFGTVITERIVDLFTLIFFILLVLILDFNFFSSFFKENVLNNVIEKFQNFNLFFDLIVLVLIVGFIVLIIIYKNIFAKYRIYNKIIEFIKGFFKGITSVLKLKHLNRFIFYTIAIWLFYILMTYVVFFSIESTSKLSLLDGIFIMCVGGIGMSMPVQNGFGAFHWLVSRALMLYGISQSDGLLYATLCHESQVIMILLLGPTVMLLIMLYKKKTVTKT